ncbi:MAG: FeoB-associated Cys-rich membrane protein [Clostridia bacterium]|nr:FeoB-associated Cys-rich membrane protein [Clostridia bacterium]
MNFWDILILAAVAGLAVLAIRTLRRKNNSGGCSCGCGGCAADCKKRKQEKETKG